MHTEHTDAERNADTAEQVRWAATRIDETTTLVQVDYAARTAAVLELGEGVVRIRLGDILPGGRFFARVDTTVESLCTVAPAESHESLPLIGEPEALVTPAPTQPHPAVDAGARRVAVRPDQTRRDELEAA